MFAILFYLFFGLKIFLNSDLHSIEDLRLFIAQPKGHKYV